MTTMPSLRVLQDNRDALLLAEVAAWLHDMGKCADAFLEPNGMGITTNCKGRPRANPHKAIFSPNDMNGLPWWSRLTLERGQCTRLAEANHDTALWKTLSRLSVDLSFIQRELNLPDIGKSRLGELILWGRPLVVERYENFREILGPLAHLAALLGYSHKIAHMEKEDSADGRISGWICSPFGADRLETLNLDNKLRNVLICQNDPRQEFILQISESFKGAPGDNRWPINEVTLWDWSFIVAALYKSELARSLLREKRNLEDMKWRLLNIQIDGWKYLTVSSGIPDLLVRSALSRDALNRVQMLLEETYPLSLEVYRDENGSTFVVPDIRDLLDIEIDGHPLSKHIQDTFQQGTVYGEVSLEIKGEVVPTIGPVSNSWNGTDKLPPISDILSKKIFLQSNHSYVRDAWTSLEQEVGYGGSKCFEQICTVCGLRPQGYGAYDQSEHYRRRTQGKECSRDCQTCKAIKRGVCSICEQRRDDRSMRWVTRELSTTIWIDEVADTNGRLALVTGYFDLIHWLSGDLVRTMTVYNPANSNSKDAEKVAKNPSFARLRRIWETTQEFWLNVCPTDKVENIQESLVNETVGMVGARLEIRGTTRQRNGTYTPGLYHAYDLVLPKGIKLSVSWDPETDRSTEPKGRFISIDPTFRINAISNRIFCLIAIYLKLIKL